MTYTKNTWQNGDIITAEKLNNIEDGIADGSGGSNIEYVTFTLNDDRGTDGAGGYGTFTSDKTYEQITQAFNAGKIVLCNVKSPIGFEVCSRKIIEKIFFNPSNPDAVCYCARDISFRESLVNRPADIGGEGIQVSRTMSVTSYWLMPNDKGYWADHEFTDSTSSDDISQ